PNDAVAVAFLPARHAVFHGAAAHAARPDEALVARVRSELGEKVEVFVEEGSAHAAIARRAEQWPADLIAVGAREHVVGRLAEQIADGVRCDVLAARTPPSRGWVLAATDLTEPSLAAVATGAELAQRRGARLLALHAVRYRNLGAAWVVEVSTPALTPTLV